ncbi:DUF2306 domain-containing protein [Spirosoma soli]|uniref:DUF2306 domain-containing protein n=1 Tax=Spirosoma soli TaxID=1770529 RepID=A0ABW5LYA2_9BACT
MLATFLHSPTGIFHLTAALLAMLFGALTFYTEKGSLRHKQVGYVYVAAMVVVNVTAFQIYALFNRFGPFHGAAIWSSISILLGMVPVILKRPGNGKWLHLHYYFMNWSVVGLYAAFWAESLVRLFPIQYFWPVVVLATVGTVVIGARLIRRHKDRLVNQAIQSKPTIEPVRA